MYFYYFEKKNDDLYNKKIWFIDNIISIFNYYTPAPPMNNIVKLTQSIAVLKTLQIWICRQRFKMHFPIFLCRCTDQCPYKLFASQYIPWTSLSCLGQAFKILVDTKLKKSKVFYTLGIFSKMNTFITSR